MEKKNTKKKSGRNPLPLLLLLAAVAVGGLVWGASAKYNREIQDTDNVVVAKEFIFSSDLLAEDCPAYTLNPGTASIGFELYNYIGDNVSGMAIPYEVSVEPAATVTITPSNGELSAGPDKQTHTVELTDLQPGTTYTVTVVGQNQYKTTLKAEFAVSGLDTGVFQSISETNAYIDLTVWTHNSSGTVTLSVPAGLIPDATDSVLSGIRNYDEGVYGAWSGTVGSMEKYSSHVYRFFKTNDYDGDDLTAQVGDTPATTQNIS